MQLPKPLFQVLAEERMRHQCTHGAPVKRTQAVFKVLPRPCTSIADGAIERQQQVVNFDHLVADGAIFWNFAGLQPFFAFCKGCHFLQPPPIGDARYLGRVLVVDVERPFHEMDAPRGAQIGDDKSQIFSAEAPRELHAGGHDARPAKPLVPNGVGRRQDVGKILGGKNIFRTDGHDVAVEFQPGQQPAASGHRPRVAKHQNIVAGTGFFPVKSTEFFGGNFVIGVDEPHKLTARSRQPTVPRRAGPHVFFLANQPQGGKFLHQFFHDRGGVVRRMVVDDDDFVAQVADGPVERFHAPADRLSSPVGRHYNAQKRPHGAPSQCPRRGIQTWRGELF